MKKIFAMLCAAAALISCAKSELVPQTPEGPDASGAVTFNVSVDDPDGTKALKTAWADGDVIYIKFNSIDNKYLAIIYNASTSSWDAQAYDNSNPAVATTFVESDFSGIGDAYKKLGAVHYPIPVNAAISGTGELTFKDDANQDVLTYCLYQSFTGYTVSGSEVNVRLSLQKPDKVALFHVPGIQASATDYTLTVSGPSATTTIYACTSGAISSVGSVSPQHKYVKSQPVPGIADEDGAIFAVWLEEGFNGSTPRDLTFTLTHSSGAQYVISGSKVIVAGNQYGLPALDSGKWEARKTFSVSSTKKVMIAPGNLQATTTDLGENWTWDFAAHQYDYIGNAAANTKINGVMSVSENGTVDLFGWVGASATYDSYGIFTEDDPTLRGNNPSDALKNDWGTLDIGSYPVGTWRSLDKEEWDYLLFTRSTTSTNLPEGGSFSSAARFTKATVCGVRGLILFPDNYVHPSITVTGTPSYNYKNSEWDTFVVAAESDWNQMEDAGAAFLPAAGSRDGTKNNTVGLEGLYWTSTVDGSSYSYAYIVNFYYGKILVAANFRYYGGSVRLARDI